jgi:hypothetical protein
MPATSVRDGDCLGVTQTVTGELPSIDCEMRRNFRLGMSGGGTVSPVPSLVAHSRSRLQFARTKAESAGFLRSVYLLSRSRSDGLPTTALR